MKTYIKDGVVFFFKYKITGTDSLSRPITLYAKDDTDRTRQVARLLDTTVLDISPSTEDQAKATEWQTLNAGKNFNIDDLENYINASAGTPVDNIVNGNEIRVYSSNNAAKKFTIDYNESEDSIDFNYN